MKTTSPSYYQSFKIHGASEGWRSYFELSVSLIFYAITLALVVVSPNWLFSIISIPLFSLAIVRLFIVQHDCGHRSFFKKIKTNNIAGRLISLLSTIPYDYWRKSHNFHHAHTGVEGFSHAGGILTLSVAEYEQASLFRKLAYLIFRQKFLLLLLIGPFALLIYYRLPLKSKKEPPTSIKLSDYLMLQLNNLFLVGAFYLLNPVAALKLLIAWYIATVVAFVIFYIQHNFDSAYFVDKKNWSFEDAAIKGSSFLKLPAPLRWATGNIGYHHLHHLYPRIPFYKLKKIHDMNGELFCSVNVVTIKDVSHLLALKFHDKEQQKMITWKEYINIKRSKASIQDS